jgi:hypothetical protein
MQPGDQFLVKLGLPDQSGAVKSLPAPGLAHGRAAQVLADLRA